MIKALRHSPDVIAKVGNSYKKRFKVASRVTTNGISNCTLTHQRLYKLKMKCMSSFKVAPRYRANEEQTHGINEEQGKAEQLNAPESSPGQTVSWAVEEQHVLTAYHLGKARGVCMNLSGPGLVPRGDGSTTLDMTGHADLLRVFREGSVSRLWETMSSRFTKRCVSSGTKVRKVALLRI